MIFGAGLAWAHPPPGRWSCLYLHLIKLFTLGCKCVESQGNVAMRASSSVPNARHPATVSPTESQTQTLTSAPTRSSPWRAF